MNLSYEFVKFGKLDMCGRYIFANPVALYFILVAT